MYLPLRRIALLFALLVGVLHADYNFATAVNLTGTTAYDDRLAIGLKYTNTTGTTVTITNLQRWVLPGNNQTHLLGLYVDDTYSSPVRSVTIDCAGKTPNSFTTGVITPYDVAPGESVYAMSGEAIAGDAWYGGGPNYPGLTTWGIGTTSSAVVSGGTISAIGNTGYTYTSIGPVSFGFSGPAVPGWSKTLATYTTTGYQFAVDGALNDASSGETVLVPSDGGPFLWGSASSYMTVKSGVTLQGVSGLSIVSLATDAPTYGNGAIRLEGSAIMRGLTFNRIGDSAATVFSANSGNQWRVTDCVYNDGWTSGGWNIGYFGYASTYGLVDNCTINVPYGSGEYLFTRDPDPLGSWTTANSLGTVNAVYMEDCTVTGAGYTDFNSGARAVVRFCTFTGTNKIDFHGYLTNSPAYGDRQFEIYNNAFTGSGGSVSCIQVRGGTGFIFDNTTVNPDGFFDLTDYGYQESSGNFGGFMTPRNLPIAFQIGTGRMSSVLAATLVAYQWSQIETVGTTNFTAIGAANNNVGTQFIATGPATGTGSVLITPATEPVYVFNNQKNGSPWVITYGNVAAGAITLYRSQTGNPAATFTGEDIITPNDKFYASAGQASLTGVSRGTFAQMQAATPTNKFGFWVTDRGSWRAGYPNASGVFYKANGTAFVENYTPLRYPHPLRDAAALTVTTLNIGHLVIP